MSPNPFNKNVRPRMEDYIFYLAQVLKMLKEDVNQKLSFNNANPETFCCKANLLPKMTHNSV